MGFSVTIVPKTHRGPPREAPCNYYLHGDAGAPDYRLLRERGIVCNHFHTMQRLCSKAALCRTIPACHYYQMTYQIAIGHMLATKDRENTDSPPARPGTVRQPWEENAAFLERFLYYQCLTNVHACSIGARIDYMCGLCAANVSSQKCRNCKLTRRRVLCCSIQHVINILRQQTLDERYVYRRLSAQSLKRVVKLGSQAQLHLASQLYDAEYTDYDDSIERLRVEERRRLCRDLISEHEQLNAT